MGLSVEEASQAYEPAMTNIASAGPGVCRVCWSFIDPKYKTCFKCGHQPENLDVVVPITYSEHLGQLHTALRNYKDGGSTGARRYAAIRLAGVLWRFLEAHEACVAHAAGVSAFDLVTIVPSSDPARDRKSPFARLTKWVRPVKKRLKRVLEPTGEVEGRNYDANRFRATEKIAGGSVLLLDDTWVTGGHAQSAAATLLTAGAEHVALVVIGRHIHPEYEPVSDSGKTCADLLEGLPNPFDWSTCAVHEEPE
jgi:predicted amidophosphoribosyltransferase